MAPKISKNDFWKMMIDKFNLPPDNPIVIEGLNAIWVKMFDHETAQALFENRYQSHLHEYICVGPQTWGRGDTPDEAFRNALKQWPKHYSGIHVLKQSSKHKKPKMYIDCGIYRCPKGSTVDEMGNINFPARTCKCPDCREVGIKKEEEESDE